MRADDVYAKKPGPGMPGPGFQFGYFRGRTAKYGYFSVSESVAGATSAGLTDSAAAAVDSVVAGTLTWLDVWPDTGPFAPPPQHPSPQPAIPMVANTANAATVFNHSRVICVSLKMGNRSASVVS
jgi:hypothetical protein